MNVKQLQEHIWGQGQLVFESPGLAVGRQKCTSTPWYLQNAVCTCRQGKACTLA